MADIRISSCVTGMIDNNVYCVINKDVNECIIIDPSFSPEAIVNIIDESGATPVAILLTHGHFDHIMSVDFLRDKYHIPVIAYADEKELLNDINICFLFAQNYHLAMKYVAPLRKELGIRTVFNILGPLTNPAGATYQVMGVYDESLVEPLAQVLSNLGVKRAMVVYGRDGLDEISASNETFVCEINENQFKTYTISPEQFGLQRCLKDELVGGTPKENAQITRDVLNGKQGGSRTAVLMNAGAGLYIGGKVDSLQAGIDLAAELIDIGKANEKLEECIKESKK